MTKHIFGVPATYHCLTLVTGKSNGLRFSNLVLEKSLDIRIPSMSLTTCLAVCKAQTDPSHIAFILEDRCICAKGKLIYNDYKLFFLLKNHILSNDFWKKTSIHMKISIWHDRSNFFHKNMHWIPSKIVLIPGQEISF